jgi:hypothetical protein
MWRGLALVALLSASEASAQRLPFTWDVPKVVGVVDVPGVMMADGVPVRIHAVRSSEKPQVLLQHVVDRFEAWGFFIPPIEGQAQPFREPQITALDMERLVSYTAIFQPNPDGTTTVLLGEADLSQPPARPSPFAPVFPGAQELIHSDVEAARSLTYSVSAKLPEVEAFYRKELAKVGYTQVENNLYRKGSDELQVLARDAQGGRVSVVVIRRAALEAPPPEQEK